MTPGEIVLCTLAVTSSSASQLLFKAASAARSLWPSIGLFGVGSGLQVLSVLVAVAVLRTLNLSELVVVAAFAYVLVPLGSGLVFGERLHPSFWIGSGLIVAGILTATL
jgi:drug/metabolite transporter (DMT)-like permease